MSGATLLEYYVYIISPVEDENLSPDGSRGMSVPAHWHTRKRTRYLGHKFPDQCGCGSGSRPWPYQRRGGVRPASGGMQCSPMWVRSCHLATRISRLCGSAYDVLSPGKTRWAVAMTC